MDLLYPTPENPLVLNFPGHTPALKNRKQPVRGKTTLKLVPNKVVRDFVRRMRPLLQGQWEQQGYSLLPIPSRIGVYVEIVFYRANPHLLPVSDGDNAYTTVQELLAGLVIDNDRQVGYGSFDVLFTPNRALEHATAYIWRHDESLRGIEEAARYWSARRQREQQPDMGVPELIREAVAQFTV